MGARIVLPLSVSLPVNEMHQPACAPMRKVMGDPGTTEQFLLPQHIYFFVLEREQGGDWSVRYTVHDEPTSGQWIKRRNTGSFQTDGDSVYQYTSEVNLLLRSGLYTGRVYAIASAVPLTFNRSLDAVTTIGQVIDLTYDASSSTVQQNVQHIYSSPYNYMMGGDYYGAFTARGGVAPRVNLMLYHVATKVDLQWSVVDSMRIRRDPNEAVRLTYMEARRMYNGNAYCFKPLRNTMAALPSSGGYDIPNIVTPTDEGLWWEGRTYFYTLPYTVSGAPDYFPLQLLMRTNGSMGSGYQLTLNQPIDTSEVFVSWLRGQFNLSKPLTDKSETKTID